jgi:hypothetical protein
VATLPTKRIGQRVEPSVYSLADPARHTEGSTVAHISAPNGVFTASTLEETLEEISLENAEHWTGPLIGGFSYPLLVRILDGRWFVGRLGYEGTVGCMNPDGSVGAKGLPLFLQLAPTNIRRWCEDNGVKIRAELVDDLGRQAPSSQSANDQPGAAHAEPKHRVPNEPKKTSASPAPPPQALAPTNPEGNGTPSATASGAKALVSRKKPSVRRGRLDEAAAIELTKNPSLTFEQLAATLGCRAGTLRDQKKCPLVAKVKAKIKAERDSFRGNSTWHDRKPEDDEK